MISLHCTPRILDNEYKCMCLNVKPRELILYNTYKALQNNDLKSN